MRFSSPTSLLVASSLALRQASASCSSFKPSGGYYAVTNIAAYNANTTTLPAHGVQTSQVYTCPTSATEGFGENLGGEDCFAHDQCFLTVPSINTFQVTGYTNLTSLAASTTESLFSLLPQRNGGLFAPLASYCGAEDPTGSSYATFCFKHDTSVYGVFIPQYTCINGTLNGCAASDHITDGTAVQICGVLPDPNQGKTLEGTVSVITPKKPSEFPHFAGADLCTAAAGRTSVSVAVVGTTALITALLML